MGDAISFAKKARDAEALAALTENPFMRITLWVLAKEYWALAGQEDNPSRSAAEASKAKQLNDQVQLGPAFQEAVSSLSLPAGTSRVPALIAWLLWALRRVSVSDKECLTASS